MTKSATGHDFSTIDAASDDDASPPPSATLAGLVAAVVSEDGASSVAARRVVGVEVRAFEKENASTLDDADRADASSTAENFMFICRSFTILVVVPSSLFGKL